MVKVIKQQVQDNLTESVSQAVDQIGGFSSFIQKGDHVLLKPNFNTSDPFPASSDLGFLNAVIRLVNEQTPAEVILGDSSTMMANTQQEMEKIGVFSLKENFPHLTIMNFDREPWISKEIPNSLYLNSVKIPDILDKVNKLILLPCLKTHSLAQFTGSLKLAVGFMKPSQRISLHFTHLQEKIAELNTLIHPQLVIMDARKCFINQGPSHGELREPNLILASTSRVDLDQAGIQIIQSYPGNSLQNINPSDLPQIKRARELKVH